MRVCGCFNHKTGSMSLKFHLRPASPRPSPPRSKRQTYGGTICNIGGDMTFNEGSLFQGGFAENSGDGGTGGAIYNYDGGVVT